MRCLPFLLLCLCFVMAAHGQSVDYDSLWRKVDTSEAHKLPQTAMEQVNAIYTMAQRDHRPAQAVRALLYRVRLEGVLQVRGTQQDRETLLTAYDTATGPARSLLALALAEYYLQKANRRGYRPAGDITGDTSTNTATWSYPRFQKEITAWQDKALAPAAQLAQLPSGEWSAMVAKGNVHSNPTLYDLILGHVLVQRMRMVFNGMQGLDSNPYFASAAAFADVQVFAQQPLPPDTAGTLRDVYALQFQLRNLLRRKDTAALLLADLQRVNYMHWAVDRRQPGADSSYYLPALQQMRARYAGQEEEGAIVCGIAQYYYDKDSLRLPKLLCDTAIALHPKAASTADCRALQSLITHPAFRLQTATVSLPGRPILASASYRNLHRVYCLLARDNDNLDLYRVSDQNRKYLRQHAFRQWEQALPDPGDFAQHRTEIKIDALPPGNYVMLVGDTATFTSLAVSQLQFTVSGIAYLNQGNDCWLMDRQSGEPLAGMKVLVEGKDDERTYFTDSEGHLKLKSRKEATTPDLTCIRGKDTLRVTVNVPAASVAESRDEDEDIRITYFTDRAVYRPGQTIYFKGIAGNDEKTKVVAGYRDVIFLYNEEGDEIDSLVVRSNRFGSFSGTFKIPAAAVPGRYNIAADDADGDLDIEVAAYKRPRFEVKLDTVRRQYRLYDTVIITGTAKAFAGFNLDKAKVRYHITSSPAGRWWLVNLLEGSHTVADDSTSTDAAGRFSLRFPAAPAAKDTAAMFFIKVTVTDANGESHDANLRLSLFRTYLHLEQRVNDDMSAGALRQLTAVARNAGGVAVETPMKITLYRVNTPTSVKHKRLWDAPDQYVMDRGTFEKDFPLDPYDDAGDEPHWPTGEKVWEQTIQSGHGKPFGLPADKLASGRYELRLQVYDTLHNLVERRDRFTYVNAVSGKAPFPAPLLVAETGDPLVAGREMSLTVCTDADTLYAIQTILTGKAGDAAPVTKREIIVLTKGANHITLQMPAEGQLTWDLAAWRDGRFYNATKHYVLQAQTGPDLRLEAHRDRLLPGEKTQWTLSLPAGTAAETMAWMYDASLDDIAHLQPDVSYPTRSSFSVYWPNLWDNIRSSNDYDWYREPRFSLMQQDALRLLEPWYNDQTTEFMDQAAPMAVVEDAAPGVAVYGARAPEKKELAALSDVVVVGYSTARKVDVSQKIDLPQPPITPRRNFTETAFFYPALYPDANGKMTLHFEMPQSLTRWQFYSIAHDRNMRMTLLGDQVVTQQPLMVMPNAPRFLREGDSLELPVKIISMTDKALNGNVQLALHDAATGAPLDAAFGNNGASRSFTLSPGSSVTQAFHLQVPAHFSGALQYTVTARGGGFTDGEENTIPVLSKTILVTNTLPLPVSGDGTRTFTMAALLHSDTTATLQQHSLKLEYTANPAWNAVQALPFLMEYPYECAEQTFNRYYANALAGYLVASLPRLQEVFKQWARNGNTTLSSTLSKNEDLKNALLAETPWVLDAAGDAARKQHVGLLFDLYKLGVEKSNAKARLANLQLVSGAFPWFSGGGEDRYITQYIVAGIGRLQRLQLSGAADETLHQVTRQALAYLDKMIAKDSGSAVLNIHYLYARSFFPDVPVDSAARLRVAQLVTMAAQHWTQYSSYEQAMLAVVLYRQHDGAKARQIMASLKENGIRDGAQGTYWKDMQPGYYWQQAPIEAAAQMLEAFNEITQDTATVNGIKTWLLHNKQVQGWSNSKATADACYALLLQGNNWLTASPTVHIIIGNEAAAPTSTAAGTGYISQQWNAPAIRPAMGQVTVTTSGTHGQPSWGALYWQYFQDIDHIQRAQTNLQLQKQLYVTVGEKLLPVTAARPVKVGDKITVRLTITTDRDMDYVHLKDLRAAGLEPVETLSGYRYDAGLSYYRATLDVSTSFFFSRLPQGTHVLEYQVYATHVGDFANGITTLQCMYAPEFSAHSGGQRIVIAQ